MNNKFATGGFNFSSIIMKNIDRNKLTYAQQIILKKASKKKEYSELQCNCYGSDYNDCHGDYYDAEYC